MSESTPLLRSILLAAAFLLAAMSAVCDAADSRVVREVSEGDLKEGKVVIIGRLGVPLGTVVEIEAVVVEANSADWPEMENRSFSLRVESVNDHALEPPPLMRFRSDFASHVWVAPTTFEMEQLVAGLRTPGSRAKFDLESGNLVVVDPIGEDEIEEFKRNYVGSKHTLLVYEAGTLDGTPKVLPDSCQTLGTLSPFGLRTHLVVLYEERFEPGR